MVLRRVIGGAEIVIGIGKAPVDFNGAIEIFAGLIQLAFLQQSDAEVIQIGRVFRIFLGELGIDLRGLRVLLSGREDARLKLIFFARAERSAWGVGIFLAANQRAAKTSSDDN